MKGGADREMRRDRQGLCFDDISNIFDLGIINFSSLLKKFFLIIHYIWAFENLWSNVYVYGVKKESKWICLYMDV